MKCKPNWCPMCRAREENGKHMYIYNVCMWISMHIGINIYILNTFPKDNGSLWLG